MRVYLTCLLTLTLGGGVGWVAAQSRQPATKAQSNPKSKGVKAARDDKDKKDAKSSDVPEKTSADTVGGKRLDEWVNDLKSLDPSRRAIAVMAIPNFGDAASKEVKHIIDRLYDTDVSPRAKACYALRIMAVDEGDVKAVVKALGGRLNPLRETQAIVRYEAAITLRRFAEDAKPIIKDLLKGMIDPDSWEIRHACVAVLWRAAIDTKEGPDKEVVTNMSLRLRAERYPPTYQEKLELIIGLGSMGRPKDPKALAEVVSVLSWHANAKGVNVNKMLQLWAFAGLVGMVDDPKQVEGHLGGIAQFTDTKHKVELRVQAIAALSVFGDRSKKYAPDMIRMLDEKEPMIVNAAATALTRIGGKDDNEKIIEAFLSMLRQHGVSKKNTPDQEKNLNNSKAAAAVIALVNLKANLKDVHDVMDKVRKDEYADRGLRHLIDQAQKQLKNPPKEKDKDKDKDKNKK